MGISVRRPMRHKDFFSQAALYLKPQPPEGYIPDEKPSYNWEDDKQPLKLSDSYGYVAIHKLVVPAWISQMADIAIKAGYARPDQKTELIRGMTEATGMDADGQKKEFKLGDISFRYRVKSTEAVDGKITESLKTPKPKTFADIGDYIAAKWVGKTLTDVVRLREASRMEGAGMTSCKCEYSHPSDEGFRSHKSHHEAKMLVNLRKIPTAYHKDVVSQSSVKDGMVPLTVRGELMITDRSSENIEAYTHSLKNAERELAGASKLFTADFSKASGEGRPSKKDDSSNVLSRLSAIALEIKELRTFCNDSVHFAQESDALTYQGRERGLPEPPNAIRSRVKSISLNSRAGIPEELKAALGPLLGTSVMRTKGSQFEAHHH
jgi:hypothetical protein